VLAKGTDGKLHYSIEANGQKLVVKEECDGLQETTFKFVEKSGNSVVRLRIDRMTGYTPYIYQIKVK
jgi:hypothetical protein